MARNRYIRSRSNYVLQQVHQSTNVGNITERNWMTIADLNAYAPGSVPSYSLGGFKMIIDDSVNLKKRHQYGSWLKNGENEDWTIENMGDNEETIFYGSSSEIALKPNFSSFLDFAYFGSATKMVESAILNIIKYFPGELYLMDKYITVGGMRLYFTDNPFNIEFDKIVFEDEKIDNILRVFSQSYSNYEVIGDTGVGTIFEWDRNIMSNDPCNIDNNLLSIISLGNPYTSDEKQKLILYYYDYNGVKQVFHNGVFVGHSIRPKNKIIHSFFQNLSDFEKTILNKKTNYTAYLETPQETEKGNVSYKKAYTWPKTGIGEWNIAVKGGIYEKYINSLLNIANFYDKYFTDNLWSSLTHEAIVNFDWTFKKIEGDGFETDFSNPNSQRMKAFIQVMGRNFDELKRYIDGISFSNTVTYDEANNNPDYFLSESLSNYGWDVKVPISSLFNKFITYPLYTGHVDGYSVQDGNYEFYRRLLLNSAAILSAKGTKRSIEMMMSLFGYYSKNFVEHAFHEVERNGEIKNLTWEYLNEDEKKEILRNVYDITEYVYVTQSGSTGFEDNTVDVVKNLNTMKLSYNSDVYDEFQGLPLREVVTIVDSPNYGYRLNSDGNITKDLIVGYTSNEKKYLIPWFDRNKKYDSEMYFESMGGWGLTHSKTNEILEYGEHEYVTGDGLKIYDEGVKYLKFKDTIEDLLDMVGEYPVVNDIYYVYDITDGDKYDWGLLGDEGQPTMSHYFILKDIEYEHVFGVIRDDENKVKLPHNHGGVLKNIEDKQNTNYPNVNWDILPTKLYGWKNISEEELRNGGTKDVERVYYMEGIIENNLGNNPHVGYGFYDDGENYKKSFETIFSSATNKEEFDGVDNKEIQELTNDIPIEEYQVFNLEKMIDNVKTWYFTDFNEEQRLQVLSKVNEHHYNCLNVETPVVGDTTISVRDYLSRGNEKETLDNDEIVQLFNSEQYSIMQPYNMEGGFPDDEASANSIINTKSLYIEFLPDVKLSTTNNSPYDMYEFIEDVVMHYVKQVIPSTTLLKYKIRPIGVDVFCYHKTYSQSALLNN
jgi:hypothetical protein